MTTNEFEIIKKAMLRVYEKDTKVLNNNFKKNNHYIVFDNGLGEITFEFNSENKLDEIDIMTFFEEDL